MGGEIWFRARGHPNITATHKTTLMTTTEAHLTKRGSCIVAVEAELGLGGLPGWACEEAKSPETRITMVLEVEGLSFSCTGRGDPGLTYTHPRDMVARRSSYTCGRTLMVGADKAAVDLPREMLEALRRGAPVEVGLLYRV